MCFVILSGAHIPRPESLRHNLSSSHVLRSDATHPRSIRIPVALPPSRGPKQPRPHHTWSLIHHPIPARTDIIYILIVTVPVITNITAILLNGFFFLFPFHTPTPPRSGARHSSVAPGGRDRLYDSDSPACGTAPYRLDPIPTYLNIVPNHAHYREARGSRRLRLSTYTVRISDFELRVLKISSENSLRLLKAKSR